MTEDMDGPSLAQLDAWAAMARTGQGTPWLKAHEADALARRALQKGWGVSLMEASVKTFHEPPRDVDWEILGNDPAGENWEEHRDPARAYRLLKAKHRKAREDRVVLLYKIWLTPAGQTGASL
jgi:hypothetical protein